MFKAQTCLLYNHLDDPQSSDYPHTDMAQTHTIIQRLHSWQANNSFILSITSYTLRSMIFPTFKANSIPWPKNKITKYKTRKSYLEKSRNILISLPIDVGVENMGIPKASPKNKKIKKIIIKKHIKKILQILGPLKALNLKI